MLKNKYKHSGMLTVEATFIFPLIFFILFGIIYLSIILYQNAVMTAESLRALNRAGAYYQYLEGENNPKAFDYTIDAKDLITVEDLKERSRYRSLFDFLPEIVCDIFGTTKTKRVEQAKIFVKSRQSNLGFDILSEQKENNGASVEEVKRDDHLFFGDAIRADITKNFINPLSKSVDNGLNLDMDKFAENKVIVSSVINKNSEFVRDIDAIYELANKYVDWTNDEESEESEESGESGEK